jgi:hypothetical protein
LVVNGDDVAAWNCREDVVVGVELIRSKSSSTVSQDRKETMASPLMSKSAQRCLAYEVTHDSRANDKSVVGLSPVRYATWQSADVESVNETPKP